MKTRITKFFVVVIAMFAFTAGSFAQVSATATASATIVAPITITKMVDMNFGNVAVNAVAGTVVLTPAGVRSTTGGVTLPANAGTVAAASFTVGGQGNFTYSITLPAAATTISSGANTMTVDTWSSNPTVIAGGTLNAGGTETLLVGGTLNVNANQAAGAYTSAVPFTVTVNYN